MAMYAKQAQTLAKPPFLFRAASDRSRGLNIANQIDALLGYEADYHADLASIPEAHVMVYDHIKWNYRGISEFSSWSVSLLWVLVHAAHKWCRCEANVLVYVMDTSTLQASRVHNAVELIRKYNVKGPKENNFEEYAQGEYLIHGKLQNNGGLWHAVKLETLVDAGLFEAFRGLKTKPGLLYQRVLALRYGYFRFPSKLDGQALAINKKLAQCFGDAWQGVMMVAFTALKQRELTSEAVTALSSELGPEGLPRLPWSEDLALRMFHMKVRDIKEACQFMQFLRLLHDRSSAHLSASDTESE